MTTIGADAGPPAARTPSWREAYQSSPGSPGGLSDDVFARFAERLQLPAGVIDEMKARRVTGTMRYRVRLAATGSKVRVRFSNEEGSETLVIAAASVAMAGEGFDAIPGTLKPLTFSSEASISIQAGAPIVSDPLNLAVQHGDELLISVHIPDNLRLHPMMGGAMIVADGDQVRRDSLQSARQVAGRPLATGVSVLTDDPPRIIVALGDSITDGVRTTSRGIHGWPERLDRRLADRTEGNHYSVVNAGIGGNRVLTSGWGVSALGRLDRDVLRIDGVTHLILLEGTNDIGMSGDSIFGRGEAVSSSDLITGYRQIIARAHERGIKVVIGTITPVAGSADYPIEKLGVREEVNGWIRTSGEPDGFIDFDLMVRDPASPERLLPLYDSGDHLHPSDEGLEAMGNGVALHLFP